MNSRARSVVSAAARTAIGNNRRKPAASAGGSSMRRPVIGCVPRVRSSVSGPSAGRRGLVIVARGGRVRNGSPPARRIVSVAQQSSRAGGKEKLELGKQPGGDAGKPCPRTPGLGDDASMRILVADDDVI